MIKKIENRDIDTLINLLETTAPEQIQFVTGPYFKHGENVSFGWYEGNELVGCIRFCIQEIGIEQKTPPIIKNNSALTEAKINVFAVKSEFKNRNIGKKLQQHVIKDAKRRGCSQLSSYSTYDKVENYAVKISLGFCVQPETQPDGTMGCYFIMKL